jgi:hypothetical protein
MPSAAFIILSLNMMHCVCTLHSICTLHSMDARPLTAPASVLANNTGCAERLQPTITVACWLYAKKSLPALATSKSSNRFQHP